MSKDEKVWFSIVVPVYNAEMFLDRCIQSILNQSFERFELILVNDGSTDHSLEICQKYALQDKAQKIKVYDRENSGSFLTRLYGTKKASGKYLLFCDADDYYKKNSFQIMYDLTSKEEYDLIQFNYVKKWNHLWKLNKVVNHRMQVEEQEFYVRDYPILLCSRYERSRLTIQVWNKIYRRELFSNNKIYHCNQRIFMADDVIFNLYLLEKCKNVLYIPESFYVYNDLTGGTNKFRPSEMEDLSILKEQQLLFFYKWTGDDSSNIENKIFAEMAGWFYTYIQQSLRCLDTERVKYMIEKTLSYPVFVEGKKYYMKHQSERWEAAKLLRESDVNKYISSARKSNGLKRPFIHRLKNRLVTIYKMI